MGAGARVGVGRMVAVGVGAGSVGGGAVGGTAVSVATERGVTVGGAVLVLVGGSVGLTVAVGIAPTVGIMVAVGERSRRAVGVATRVSVGLGVGVGDADRVRGGVGLGSVVGGTSVGEVPPHPRPTIIRTPIVADSRKRRRLKSIPEWVGRDPGVRARMRSYRGCFAGSPGRLGNLAGVGFTLSTTTSTLSSSRPSSVTPRISRSFPPSTSMA